MNHTRFIVTAISLLLGTLCAADAIEPSFDCAKAKSDAEHQICKDAALSKLDARLATVYKAAADAAESLDVGAEEATNTLRATQRGWIKGRDDCWKSASLSDCIEASYLVREGELVAMWMLQEPTSVVAYTCDNNPANEVYAHFFATQLPSVRLEYGDGIKTGWSVPAASGSKYAINFGGFFWAKGNDALFAWTEGEEMQCSAIK